MADDLKDTIQDSAKEPQSAEVDGTRVKQHSLRDQIAADKYLVGKRTGANPAGALSRVKLIPPGTV